MAKIIYKIGYEEQNKLSCIEGIEIDLLNGQKALIYPKYSEEMFLPYKKRVQWKAEEISQIEALKVTDTNNVTQQLLALESPAALWVTKFRSDVHGIFCLPSLLAALELQHQKDDIDALAETIEGADLLRDFTFGIISCARCDVGDYWSAGEGGRVCSGGMGSLLGLVVPIILYRKYVKDADKTHRNIWHDASEEPQGEWEILIIDNVGEYLSYTKEEVRQTYDVKRGWKGFVKGAEVVKWAYISDII